MHEINEFKNRYAFLSNFSAHGFIDSDGYIWKTVEHYYQAMKTLKSEERESIRKLKTPSQAKRRGRKVSLRSGWEKLKVAVMFRGLCFKFEQNIEIKKDLLNTGTARLVEGNYWHDNFWGSCTCSHCCTVEGQNKLGKLLMKVRSDFSLLGDN